MNYEIPWQTTNGWSQFGNLVSISAPGYLSPEQAVSEFFDGVATSRNSPPFDQCRVRIGCTDAWIDQIHVKPTSIDMEIVGTSVEGCRLELNSTAAKAEHTLTAAGTVEFATPDGLPDATWVMLSKDGSLLDSRHIGPPWGVAGVTTEAPPIGERLAILIAGGEGPTSEYKVQLPKSNKENLKFAATVAAFCNGQGGTLVFGVENETLTTVNLSVTQGDLDRLHDIIRNLVDPQPESLIVESAVVGQHTVVAVTVQKGTLPPYGIHPNSLDIYVRRGANTVRAHHEEIVSLATPATSGTSMSGFLHR